MTIAGASHLTGFFITFVRGSIPPGNRFGFVLVDVLTPVIHVAEHALSFGVSFRRFYFQAGNRLSRPIDPSMIEIAKTTLRAGR